VLFRSPQNPKTPLHEIIEKIYNIIMTTLSVFTRKVFASR
jgi:hypothetical protein